MIVEHGFMPHGFLQLTQVLPRVECMRRGADAARLQRF